MQTEETIKEHCTSIGYKTLHFVKRASSKMSKQSYNFHKPMSIYKNEHLTF